jgi:hypothetical protein
MNMPQIPAPARLALLGALLLSSGGAGLAQQRSGDDWARHFRVGAQIGLNISAEFTQSGQSGVSGNNPGPAGVSGQNHFYDDGYVRVDDTGNAAGFTSFWGYQSAGQHNAGAQTLTFHSAQSFTQSGKSTVDEAFVGFDLAYGWNLGPALGGWLGLDLGFGLLPIGVEDDRNLTTTARRTVHQFNTGGIVLPDAPYNGGSSGIGPTIPDVATALPDDVVAGTITGARELDVNLYSLRLGPTLQWQLGDRWAIQLSAGGAVGLVDGDYRFNETLRLADGSTAVNRGSKGTSDVVYGGYASALLLWRAVPGGELYLGAQFMSLGNTKVSTAGREAALRLSSGIYVLAGVNWPF